MDSGEIVLVVLAHEASTATMGRAAMTCVQLARLTSRPVGRESQRAACYPDAGERA